MIKLYEGGAYLINGSELVTETETLILKSKLGYEVNKQEAKKGTIAYGILAAHNTSKSMENLKIKFDAMTSHDITYVGIIQTARASGMKDFPMSFNLTNCHNSLCAVGGTLNEDDHLFGLSACQKYGGNFVPSHMAVMHQYMREMVAGCGMMILGSDSHTRYGALGTIAIGEGGGELVKQLLKDTYDINYPKVICVYLTGKPNPGIGPHDIALSIIGKVFKNAYVKNSIMEFVGPGVSSMTTDYRNAIDVMTTETACLSSIWRTDGDTKVFLTKHGRADEYKELNPASVAYYEGVVYVDLSTIESTIALPFHPSNTYTIKELNANLKDILTGIEKTASTKAGNKLVHYSLLDKIIDGKFYVQQGEIAGCCGGNYVNIMDAAHILRNASCGNGAFSLSVYPSSQPVYLDLLHKGAISTLIEAGAIIKTACCGPCFGACDTPANNTFSIRHTTRNFPNRDGSNPVNGQMAAVALMDARSIAATAANGGVLTSATDFADDYAVPEDDFDVTPYKKRVYYGFGNPHPETELICGPNIKDWPEMQSLKDNILLKVASKIMDEVTTTDELIPSGETSTYRSNPLKMAEFTLYRRDPAYVTNAKTIGKLEEARLAGENPATVAAELEDVYKKIATLLQGHSVNPMNIEIGSMIYAVKPGDGSAREQAASCQRVLGGLGNICKEYATKRYRSNVINWGMLPFQMKEEPNFSVGDYIYIPNVKKALDGNLQNIQAYVIGKEVKELTLYIAGLTDIERAIIKAGSLINYNKQRNK